MAIGPGLRHRRLQRLGGASGKHHAVARRQQRLCHRLADAARGARHQRNLALLAHAVFSWISWLRGIASPLGCPPYLTGIGVLAATGTAVTLFCGLPETSRSE